MFVESGLRCRRGEIDMIFGVFNEVVVVKPRPRARADRMHSQGYGAQVNRFHLRVVQSLQGPSQPDGNCTKQVHGENISDG